MPAEPAASTHPNHHLRFLTPHLHLAPVFGSGWFGQKAEQFARFFGTPTFLIIQSVIVAAWIGLNIRGVFHFDPFPLVPGDRALRRSPKSDRQGAGRLQLRLFLLSHPSGPG